MRSDLIPQLNDALPKVGEPENVWCSVHASTLRDVVAALEVDALSAAQQAQVPVEQQCPYCDPGKAYEVRLMRCRQCGNDFVTGPQHDAALAAYHAPSQPVPADRIKIPTNEDEAAGMALLGTKWLEDNAPHRLLATSQPVRPVAGKCVCGEPWRLGSVHRVDGPCYVPEQQAEPAPEINLADLAAAVNELDTCAARGMAANAAMWKLAAAARSLVGAVDPHKPHFQGSPR